MRAVNLSYFTAGAGVTAGDAGGVAPGAAGGGVVGVAEMRFTSRR